VDLFRRWISDCANELTDLVAHGLGCNTCGCGFKVDVAGATDTSIEGIAFRHEGMGHGTVFLSVELDADNDERYLLNMDGGSCGGGYKLGLRLGAC